jgi:hypothetical protein
VCDRFINAVRLLMSVRRRDSRLEVVNAEGVLRVLRDVMVRRTDNAEFIAISGEPGVRGEVLTIFLAKDGHAPFSVRVVDSKPTMVEGSVRHQLRLRSVDADAVEPLSATGSGCQEAE